MLIKFITRGAGCRPGTRVMVFLHLVYIVLLFGGVGAGIIKKSKQSVDKFALYSHAAGWAATISFSFVSLAISSSFFQMVYHYFNFNTVHVAFHKFHLHRNMAICGGVFTVVHGVLQYVSYLHKIPKKEWCTDNSWNPFATGMIIFVSFLLSGISGYLSTLRNSPKIISSAHMPLACLGIFMFNIHSCNQDIFTEAKVLMITCLVCGTIYGAFFFFNPIIFLEVDSSKTLWNEGGEFMFLVVKYYNTPYVPPGAFFLIYASPDTNLSFFHGHSFPVFSYHNRELVFLVQVRRSTKRLNGVSFTQRFAATHYLIHGFFYLICL